jgi:hypothetical protein
MLEIANAHVPEFVTVTVCALEAVPTAWPGNVRLEVERSAVGTPPIPDKGMA